MADRVITVTTASVVTNDTLDSYNNYSDQDGLLGSMTPAEASAGKTVTLSDGVVHSVTTKPVGTSNGEFAAVVSNAVTVDLSGSGSTVLWEDDFSGDLSKWTLANPSDPSPSIGIVSGELVFETDGAIGGGFGDDYVIGQTGYDVASGTHVYTFDVYADETTNNEPSQLVGISSDASRTTTLSLSLAAGGSFWRVGGNMLSSTTDTTVATNNGLFTTWKFVFVNGNLTVSSWNGSSWVSQATETGVTGTYYPYATLRGNGTSGDQTKLDNWKIVDADFAGQRP